MPNDLSDFTLPTGPLKHKLTNDYMFKAFLQRNKKALSGLICALLRLNSNEIKSISIMNPIELGDTIIDKLMILDIKLILNNERIINIEMQVDNLGDWEERSLTYLCKAFNQLNTGDDYRQALATIQVGILDFTPNGFPPKLFMKYNMINSETNHIYSDKLTILMLQLNQLGNPEDEKTMPDLYYWVQLFRASTWEEISMLAEKNEAIKDSIITLKQLSEDEKIRMQCEARERYRRDLSSATQQGISDGVKQGLDKMSKLTNMLLQENKLDILQRATEDNAFREELFKKYNI